MAKSVREAAKAMDKEYGLSWVRLIAGGFNTKVIRRILD